MTALLVAGVSLSACVAAPGPYQIQADNAAQACQQGYREACYDYQAIAPAAQAEAAQGQQDAAVGTAVAAGVLGAVAGAAIVGATQDRGYRRGYSRGYYRRGWR